MATYGTYGNVNFQALNDDVCACYGQHFSLDELEDLLASHVDDLGWVDLKVVRNLIAAPADPECPHFDFVMTWEGTPTEMQKVFDQALTRAEWSVNAYEVRNARKSDVLDKDPFWRPVGATRHIGKFDALEEAQAAYDGLDPEVEFRRQRIDYAHACLVELSVEHFNKKGERYSCGLCEDKVWSPRMKHGTTHDVM